MRNYSGYLVALLIIGLLSCDRPGCKNQDPVFDRFSYDSQEYKQELAHQIDELGMDNLSYWFDGYAQLNGNEYILVNIQNDSLCATGMIQVKDWRGMEEIKRTKGASYKGAELKGLSFDMIRSSEGVEFVFGSLDKVVD